MKSILTVLFAAAVVIPALAQDQPLPREGADAMVYAFRPV